MNQLAWLFRTVPWLLSMSIAAACVPAYAKLASGVPPGVQEAVESAYQRSAGRQLWPNGKDRAVIQVLASSAEDGLFPGDYVIHGNSAAKGYDREVTRALARYIADLRAGRQALRTADSELFVQPPELDLVALLEGAVAAADLAHYSQSLRPANFHYQRLREVLSRYRKLAAAGGWQPVPAGASIKPGEFGPHVAAMRQRLVTSGDLRENDRENGRFDGTLEAALERFQRRHGLEPDKVAGPETIKAMNTSVEERITQVQVNLERWRWMPDDLGERHVLVNIAGFELNAVRAGLPPLTMRVVVGKPYRQSPVFSDAVRYMDLNPTWTPTVSLIRQDIVPNAKKDRGYLAREGFRVTSRASGAIVDPANIDWSAAKGTDYQFVQQPGPKNALGTVKFMFPNQHAVYLHDTPSRGLFARRVRTFSSGCIRIEQPVSLAAWLLADTDWDDARVKAAIATGQTRTIKLKQPVPIHLTYSTVWVDAQGIVHFRPDVYRRDELIARVLRTSQQLDFATENLPLRSTR